VIEHPDSIPPEIKKYLDLKSRGPRPPVPASSPRASSSGRCRALVGPRRPELVAALAQHRNGWHRPDTAARLLHQRKDILAIRPLEKLAEEAKLPEGRMHALYALRGPGRP